MVTVPKITELDFDQIKTDLKTYLKAQDRFKDYDFEASNMSVLLDILAYNTFQNNFYNNMVMSEMFFDSAQLRDSIVSHSKSLGYIPSSRTSATARINLTLSVGSPYPNFITVPEKTAFRAICGNKTYTFYNKDSFTITPVNNRYIAYGIDIYEGRYVTEAFNVTGDESQRFIISNKNVDTSSIKVTVKETESDPDGTEYTVRTNIFDVNPTDNIFYLQPYFDDLYEVAFGKDIFGANPQNGNVVVIEYRTTVGEEANGINQFSLINAIDGYNGTVSVVQNSTGGCERESNESIRFFAPKSIQVQDRAVTESDYEILLRNNFPEIQAVSVYGGEELTPPQYGRVAIAISVSDAIGLSNTNRNRYYNYLKDRAPIGIEPIIVRPQYMYLSINSNVYYNTVTTSNSAAAIKQIVKDAILSYGDTSLSDFKTVFRHSKLSAAIDDADENILSNNTEVLAIIPFNPLLNVSNTLSTSFNNRLKLDHPLTEGELITTHKPAVRSSTFTYNGATGFIQDDGQGKLLIVQSSQSGTFVYLNRDIGTVNYNTGELSIRDFNISAYAGAEIRLFGRTRAEDITPPKNRILTIRETDIIVNVYGERR